MSVAARLQEVIESLRNLLPRLAGPDRAAGEQQLAGLVALRDRVASAGNKQ